MTRLLASLLRAASGLGNGVADLLHPRPERGGVEHRVVIKGDGASVGAELHRALVEYERRFGRGLR